MKFSKSLINSAVCAGMMLCASETTWAAAYATSVLTLDNVKLTVGNATTTNVKQGDFKTLTGTNNSNFSSTLNGTVLTQGNITSSIITGPAFGALDLLSKPQGSGAPADDDYSTISVPPVTDTYANADADLAGSIIDIGGQSAGSTAQTRADISLLSLGDGGAQSHLGLSSDATFEVGAALLAGFTISFDYVAFLQTYLSPEETVNPVNVFADMSWGLTLKNNVTNARVRWNPDELNDNSSLNGPGTSGINNSGYLSFFTGVLNAGQTYTLTINHDVNVSGNSRYTVPEPTTLSILGLGLLGFAMRKQNKVA